MPEFPPLLKEFLLSFQHVNEIDVLYAEIMKKIYHPKNDSDIKWLQDSVVNAINLFMSSFFPLVDKAENDVLRRVWSSVDTAFDYF